MSIPGILIMPFVGVGDINIVVFGVFVAVAVAVAAEGVIMSMSMSISIRMVLYLGLEEGRC